MLLQVPQIFDKKREKKNMLRKCLFYFFFVVIMIIRVRLDPFHSPPWPQLPKSPFRLPM